jgi:hypothetical protein
MRVEGKEPEQSGCRMRFGVHARLQKMQREVRCWWLNWEAEIGRIRIRGKPGQRVCETPSQQKKAGLGGL